MRSIIALLFSFTSVLAQITYGKESYDVLCATEQTGFFQMPHSGPRFEDCPKLSNVEVVNIDLTTFCFITGTCAQAVAAGAVPCDPSTYVTAAQMKGKVGIAFQVHEALCLYGHGSTHQNLPDIFYPAGTYAATYRSYGPPGFFLNAGTVGFIFIGTHAPSYINDQVAWGPGWPFTEPLPQQYISYSVAIIPGLFFPAALDFKPVVNIKPFLPVSPERPYTHTQFGHGSGLLLFYYIVAWPWSLFVVLFAFYWLFKNRAQAKRPVYAAVFLEGACAGLMRVIEIGSQSPGTFMAPGFFFPMTAWLDELGPTVSACSSLFSAAVFAVIAFPSTLKGLTNTKIYIVCSILSAGYLVAMCILIASYANVLTDLTGDQIPTLQQIRSDAEFAVEPAIAGVSAAVVGLFCIVAVGLMRKVFSVSETTKDRSNTTLLLYIGLQVIGGIVGLIGTILGIGTNEDVAKKLAEANQPLGGLRNQIVHDACERAAFLQILSYGLKIFGYLVMGSAQLRALSLSSSSSSSSALASASALSS